MKCGVMLLFTQAPRQYTNVPSLAKQTIVQLCTTHIQLIQNSQAVKKSAFSAAIPTYV